MHKEFTILEDIVVHSVPDGIKTTLSKGKTGIISQSLGNNYTIIVEGNMYQLNGIDGEKIGEEKIEVNSNNFANEEEVWNVLHTCYDPEIPVNIVDLGLVYNCEIKDQEGGVSILIEMTLTAPGCGMGPAIAADAQNRMLALPGIDDASVEVVWDPPWHQSMITENGKKILGIA